jgi:hypothetical protein
MNTTTKMMITCLSLAACTATLSPQPASAHAPGLGAATCRGEPATIVGSSADDVLKGTSGPDVIAALEGNDIVFGGEGDDLICGGDGSDRLEGEEGDDRVYGERDLLVDGYALGDLLWGGPGDDRLDPGRERRPHDDLVSDEVHYNDSPVGVTVDLVAGTATGEGDDTLVVRGGIVLVGSDHDDVLLGSDDADLIVSLRGRDLVHGRGGTDMIVSTSSDTKDALGDVFAGGPGDDFVVSGEADDVVRGNSGNDTLVDVGGRLDIDGGGDSDAIVAIVGWGPGAHRVIGGAGRDYFGSYLERGGPDDGNVRGRVDLRRGTWLARMGDVTSHGVTRQLEGFQLPRGRWTFVGDSGPQWVSADYHRRSRLFARTGGGNDRVWGAGGNDRLAGGSGFDRVSYSGGADKCTGFEVGTLRSCGLSSQKTLSGRNCTEIRGPAWATFGTACSQVRWHEPPITTRSPWPISNEIDSPPPRGRIASRRGSPKETIATMVSVCLPLPMVSPCQATESRPSR